MPLIYNIDYSRLFEDHATYTKFIRVNGLKENKTPGPVPLYIESVSIKRMLESALAHFDIEEYIINNDIKNCTTEYVNTIPHIISQLPHTKIVHVKMLLETKGIEYFLDDYFNIPHT